jgi:hypothetical protein
MYIHPYYFGLISGFLGTVFLEVAVLLIASIVTVNKRRKQK